MNSHDYTPRIGKITAKATLADDTVGMTIKVSGPAFRFVPGQFVMLSALGFGEVPIGIASSPETPNTIEVAIRKMGGVTEHLCELPIGAEVGISGPFGNGLPMAKLKNRDVVIVAGGIGLPPLRSFVKQIESNPKYVKSLKIINGARTPELLMYDDEYEQWSKFAELYLTVDSCGPDWEGCVGQVTKLFEKAKVKKGSVMLVCGPPPMFDPVIKYFAGKRVADSDLYLFLERKMHCGIGKCQHCTCGQKYICLDGPVMSYDELKYNPEAFS